VPWTPDDVGVAEYAAILRALLPGWAVVWDPFALVWVAVRGKDGPQVTASTPARLVQRALRAPGQDVTGEAAALEAALSARGLHAIAHPGAVTVWRPGDEDSAVLVVAVRPPAGQTVWTWQRGDHAVSHPLDDIEGTAEAVAAFLAEPPP